MKHYGLTQKHIRTYRIAMAYGASFEYCMAHLAQTYRTRKVMYNDNRMQ